MVPFTLMGNVGPGTASMKNLVHGFGSLQFEGPLSRQGRQSLSGAENLVRCSLMP